MIVRGGLISHQDEYEDQIKSQYGGEREREVGTCLAMRRAQTGRWIAQTARHGEALPRNADAGGTSCATESSPMIRGAGHTLEPPGELHTDAQALPLRV